MSTPDPAPAVHDIAALVAERDAWKREALAARQRELATLVARMIRVTTTLPPHQS